MKGIPRLWKILLIFPWLKIGQTKGASCKQPTRIFCVCFYIITEEFQEKLSSFSLLRITFLNNNSNVEIAN